MLNAIDNDNRPERIAILSSMCRTYQWLSRPKNALMCFAGGVGAMYEGYSSNKPIHSVLGMILALAGVFGGMTAACNYCDPIEDVVPLNE